MDLELRFEQEPLCTLIPRNELAKTIVKDTHEEGGIPVVKTRGNVYGFAVVLGGPYQGRSTRLLLFGRGPLGVYLKDSNWSRLHCSIDINASSGELILRRLTNIANVSLDTEKLVLPKDSAMLFRTSRHLRLGKALFEIVWPKFANKIMPQYRAWKLDAAKRRQTRWESETDAGATHNAEELQTLASTQRCITQHPELAEDASDPHSGRPPHIYRNHVLGRGGFGTVYLAVDRNTASHIAVKEIPLTDDNIKYTYQEVAMHLNREKSLEHKNILRAYDWREVPKEVPEEVAKEVTEEVTEDKIQIDLKNCPKGHLGERTEKARADIGGVLQQVASDKKPKIVDEDMTPDKIQIDLEYCPEGHLGNHTEKARADIGRVLQQVASGLHFLHDEKPGIVHRDIKPQNILVTLDAKERLVVKLADFGIANYVRNASTLCCGSMNYMAPEVMEGNDDEEFYTGKVDIYSLGVVILEILGALDGFEDDIPKLRKRYQRVIRRAEGFASQDPCQSPWAKLLMDMTSKDPAKRPSAIDILARFPDEPDEPDEPDKPDDDMDDATSTVKAFSGASNAGVPLHEPRDLTNSLSNSSITPGSDMNEEDERGSTAFSNASLAQFSVERTQVLEGLRANDRRQSEYPTWDRRAIHEYLEGSLPARRRPKTTRQDSCRQKHRSLSGVQRPPPQRRLNSQYSRESKLTTRSSRVAGPTSIPQTSLRPQTLADDPMEIESSRG